MQTHTHDDGGPSAPEKIIPRLNAKHRRHHEFSICADLRTVGKFFFSLGSADVITALDLSGAKDVDY